MTIVYLTNHVHSTNKNEDSDPNGRVCEDVSALEDLDSLDCVLPLRIGEKVIVHDGEREFVMEAGDII